MLIPMMNHIRRWDRLTDRKIRVLTVVQLIASILIVLSILPYTAQFTRSMSTTSLWVDELNSVLDFSSRGPIATISSYRQPNNHILFNLVNALTPDGPGRYDPFRARIWSFIFYFAAIILVAAEFVRRRLYIEGAVFVQFTFVNFSLLDLMLQARGYSILALAVAISSILVVKYCEKPSRNKIFALAGVTALGAWSVPSYLLFGGILFGLLLIRFMRWEIVLAGAAAAAGALILYLPIMPDLVYFLNNYGHHFSFSFATTESVTGSLRRYLLNRQTLGIEPGEWFVFLLPVVLACAPFFVRKSPQFVRSSLGILGASVVLFLAACLALKTPPIRTTSFLLIPLAICLLGHFSRIIRASGSFFLLLVIVVALPVHFVNHSREQTATYQFLPLENWMRIAKFIERTFPDDSEIAVSFRKKLLRPYLAAEFRLTKNLDDERFADGDQIFLETEGEKADQLDISRFIQKSPPIKIPSRDAYNYVYVCPPLTPMVSGARVAEEELPVTIYDRDCRTAWEGAPESIQFDLVPGLEYRSLWLILGSGGIPVRWDVFISRGDVEARLPKSNVHRHGDLLVVELGDLRIDGIRMVPTVPRSGQTISIAELWAYPVCRKQD